MSDEATTAPETPTVKPRSILNLWGDFLANEKVNVRRLTPKALGGFVLLVAKLANTGAPPRYNPHSEKLKARELVVKTAMDAGIDMGGWTDGGLVVMGRGLLDAWNAEYVRRFGSNMGTSGALEAARRDVKTRLGREPRA